jgi:hypothetical protein
MLTAANLAGGLAALAVADVRETARLPFVAACSASVAVADWPGGSRLVVGDPPDAATVVCAGGAAS